MSSTLHAAGAVPRSRIRWFAPASPLPGFTVSLMLTLLWLTLIVLIPLAALVLRPWEHGWQPVWVVLSDPRVLASLRLSFGAAALAAMLNIPLGLLLAWVLVRIPFPGRGLLDGLIDLPFALPTAVAGITLTTLYGPNGWLGAPLGRLGIKVAYTPLGILMALIFVGLPFVVRTVEPVLRDLPHDVEQAAATLGAAPGQIFRRVILPALSSSLVTGAGLAFARGVGEYGSVIFIAGNLPMVSEIAPLMIVIKLQQYDYAGAAAIGLTMLIGAAAILVVVATIGRAWRPDAA